MKIKEGSGKKVFSGNGNIRIEVLLSSSPIFYRVNNGDENEVREKTIYVSSKNKVYIHMKSEGDFTIKIFHNGKIKRF